jgi:hypothetical protein
MLRFWQHWNYSLVLLAAYLGTFHLWLHLDQTGVLVSGLLITVVLGVISLFAAVQGYFANRVDFIAHSVVILDIILEATIIPAHSGLTFYFCAIGFALVIGAYRSRCLRQPAPVDTP